MKHKIAVLIALLIVSTVVVGILLGNVEAQEVNAPGMHTSPGNSNAIGINEVMFNPEDGESEWVEIKNTGDTAVYLGGYVITDEDGHWYEIPQVLPPVPGDGFVVVVFDGLGSGSDDLDFGDQVATLHSPVGLVDVFEEDTDQVALYAANKVFLPVIFRNGSAILSFLIHTMTNYDALSIISFVAWGAEPAEDAATAVEAGIWSPEWYLRISKGSGFQTDAWIVPGESIGIKPGSETSYLKDWTLFSKNETSRGSENPYQAISWYFPPDGSVIDGDSFFVRWNWETGATGYQFQLDDSPDFSSPIVDTTVDDPMYVPEVPMADGTYFWRVKILYDGFESPWSVSAEVNTRSLSAFFRSDLALSLHPSDILTKTLGLEWQIQQKDTLMLDLDGSPETGEGRWDSSHEDDGDLVVGNGELLLGGEIGSEYCVRSSISMIASYYGGDLSQDRISYQIFGGGEPEGDLGYGKGVGTSKTLEALEWALNESVAQFNGKPSFSQIKAWINADQPIGAADPEHMGVIDGFGEISENGETEEWIRLVDPAVGLYWIQYESVPFNNMWVGPSGPDSAPNVRSDEDVDGDGIPDTVDDSDGDGICDFDERVRFQGDLGGLDPNDMDSDDDLVTDKADIRGYLFDNEGKYDRKRPDWDGDSQRKEIDPDNDSYSDILSQDGCEDTNLNGKFEPARGETSNFDSSSENNCSQVNLDDMIFIPAGEFLMGCHPDHNEIWDCQSWALPLHAVFLDAYLIDKYEVTNGKYAQCVSAGACTPPQLFSSTYRSSYYDNPTYMDYPVINVSWTQASEYCSWLGKRLPTEAEWEKAANGSGAKRTYPWGDQPLDCTLANYGGWDGCVGDTDEVGIRPAGASPYGVLDMAGNVEEWINDTHADDYYSVSPYINPPGPPDHWLKVIRGGSWGADLFSLILSSRSSSMLSQYYATRGFRCALDAE